MSFHVDLPESRNDAEHEDALSPVERTFLDTHAKGCWNVLPCGVPDPMADCNSGVRFTHWTVQFELSEDAEAFRRLMAALPEWTPHERMRATKAMHNRILGSETWQAEGLAIKKPAVKTDVAVLPQKQAKCAAKGRPFYIEKQSGEREGFATIHEFLRAGWVAADASMTR